MRTIKQFSILIIFMAALLFGGCSTTGNTVVEKGMPQGLLPPAHHTKNGFRNIYDNTEHGLADYLRWKLGYLPDEEPAITHCSEDTLCAGCCRAGLSAHRSSRSR